MLFCTNAPREKSWGLHELFHGIWVLSILPDDEFGVKEACCHLETCSPDFSTMTPTHVAMESAIPKLQIFAIPSLPLANEGAVVETTIGEGDVGHVFAKDRNSHRWAGFTVGRIKPETSTNVGPELGRLFFWGGTSISTTQIHVLNLIDPSDSGWSKNQVLN